MVAFYKPQKKVESKKAFEISCHSLDLHGRGVGRYDGKIYFVEGLMPDETARVVVKNQKGKTADATITKITKVSDKRRNCDCPYLESCGGCSIEHLPLDMALEAKIKGIEQLFLKSCKVELPKISHIFTSKEFGYRRSCRLSARTDHKKIVLGFRGAKSHDLVAISSCKVLTDRINQAIDEVRALVNKLEAKKKLGHVEFLDSDGALGILLRVSTLLNDNDKALITDFGNEHSYCMSIAESYEHEIDKTECIRETVLTLQDNLYITADDCKIKCRPSSFVQINKEINDALVKSVIEACNLNKDSQVLDMFCGLGNFTLPLAKYAKKVVGVEIVKSMVDLGVKNASDNNLTNVSFVNTDLEYVFENQVFAKQNYDVVVMDPGRSGAVRGSLFVAKMKPKKLVMISCNPLASARDAVELFKAGYKISSWSIFDMFPRTIHAETMFVFSL